MLKDVLNWVNDWWALAGEIAAEPGMQTVPENPWQWDGYVYQSTQLPDAVSGVSVKPLKDFLRAIVATWDASLINGPKPTQRELHSLSSDAWAAYQALESQMQDSIQTRKRRQRSSKIIIGGQEFEQGSDIHLLWTWRGALRSVDAEKLPLSSFDRFRLFPTREADGALLRLERKFPVQVQRVYEFLKVLGENFDCYLAEQREENKVAVWHSIEALLFRVDTTFGLIVDAANQGTDIRKSADDNDVYTVEKIPKGLLRTALKLKNDEALQRLIKGDRTLLHPEDRENHRLREVRFKIDALRSTELYKQSQRSAAIVEWKAGEK